MIKISTKKIRVSGLEESPTMKFDDTLQQKVGEFGRHQKILVLMLSMVLCSAGVQIMMTVFTLHVPEHR